MLAVIPTFWFIYFVVCLCIILYWVVPDRGDAPSRRVYPREYKLTTPEERQRLFKKLGVKYTQELVFSEPCKDLSNVQKETLCAYLFYKASYEVLSNKYGPYVASKHMAPVAIQWVSDHVGYGLFAERDIAKDAFIMEYTGEVVRKADDSTWSWLYPMLGGFWHIKGKFVLDAQHYGNEARFANHGEQPNMQIEPVYQGTTWHIVYVALRDIKKGEQLLVHYGKYYWENQKKTPVETTVVQQEA